MVRRCYIISIPSAVRNKQKVPNISLCNIFRYSVCVIILRINYHGMMGIFLSIQIHLQVSHCYRVLLNCIIRSHIILLFILCTTIHQDFVLGQILIFTWTAFVFFQVCRRAGDPNKFMFCKRCDDAYHCYCQQPPHKVSLVHLTCFILILLHTSSNPLVFYLPENYSWPFFVLKTYKVSQLWVNGLWKRL